MGGARPERRPGAHDRYSRCVAGADAQLDAGIADYGLARCVTQWPSNGDMWAVGTSVSHAVPLTGTCCPPREGSPSATTPLDPARRHARPTDLAATDPRDDMNRFGRLHAALPGQRYVAGDFGGSLKR
jgi:hypothetical protein